MSLEERFWSRVKKTPTCWIWTGQVSKGGYGRLRVGKRMPGAHRVSWELTRGPIPTGLDILHTCDVRLCVNPRHLFLGTDFDNQRDASRKGRLGGNSGERNGSSKLTLSKVHRARRLYSQGFTQRRLAEDFGVSQPTIGRAIRGVTWR